MVPGSQRMSRIVMGSVGAVISILGLGTNLGCIELHGKFTDNRESLGST